jgi:hypothetical protein
VANRTLRPLRKTLRPLRLKPLFLLLYFIPFVVKIFAVKNIKSNNK